MAIDFNGCSSGFLKRMVKAMEEGKLGGKDNFRYEEAKQILKKRREDKKNMKDTSGKKYGLE